jgi:hypothetical protein
LIRSEASTSAGQAGSDQAVSSFDPARVEDDLRHYLQNRSTIISPEISHVITDIVRFISVAISEGFNKALAEMSVEPDSATTVPFIDICDALIEHHIRFVRDPEQQLVGKSLFEAYVYFAGPRHVFDPVGKTMLIQTLRRRGDKSFITLFLSLHLFNVVSTEIRDDVSLRLPDAKSSELYMLSVEAKCRDVVRRAVDFEGDHLDETWAFLVRNNIERQLIGRI